MATILIKNRPALFKWLWNPDLNFGEGYMSGAVEVRGDLVEMLEAVYRAMGDAVPRPWWLPAPSNGVHASRENVHHHYDLGNEFYRLWLDREMVYTCAYFQTPAQSLEDAQVAKMAHICRKLRLAPDERVVEAGCGWGSLALFMAREYGVRVTRLQYLVGTDCLCARARGPRRAERSRRVHRGRLSERQRRL